MQKKPFGFKRTPLKNSKKPFLFKRTFFFFKMNNSHVVYGVVRLANGKKGRFNVLSNRFSNLSKKLKPIKKDVKTPFLI
jgi:hypothetical protein